jgi:hypothetical protein
MAVIIVKEFFIKHINHHKDDVKYWLKETFQSCQKRKDLVMFFNNIFSLFPNGDNPKLVRELLKHPDSMMDEVCCLANAMDHKIQYSKLVETGLQTIKNKMHAGTMPSTKNHASSVCSCSFPRLGSSGLDQPAEVSHSLKHHSATAEGKVWRQMK